MKIEEGDLVYTAYGNVNWYSNNGVQGGPSSEH